MTVLSAPLYAKPLTFNLELSSVAEPVKELLSTEIEGLPVTIAMNVVNGAPAVEAKFGNAIFRVPASSVNYLTGETKNLINAQFDAIKVLNNNLKGKKVQKSLDQLIKTIDEVISAIKVTDLENVSPNSIPTVDASALTLAHGTSLVEGEIVFPDATDDGQHKFKIAYFDSKHPNFKDEDENFSYEGKDQTNLRFYFTELRGWNPARECQSAEHAYSITLPSDLNENTSIDDIEDICRTQIIDYLLVCWGEEFGPDLTHTEFADTVLNAVRPYISYINTIKAIYKR